MCRKNKAPDWHALLKSTDGEALVCNEPRQSQSIGFETSDQIKIFEPEVRTGVLGVNLCQRLKLPQAQPEVDQDQLCVQDDLPAELIGHMLDFLWPHEAQRWFRAIIVDCSQDENGAQLFSIKYFDGSQENVARNAGDPRHREWKECVEIEDSDIEAGFNAMTKPRAGQASRQICDANAANWVQQNMGAKQADRCDALVIAVDRIFIQTFEALLLLGADIHAIGRCGISASEKVQNSKSKHMKELLNMWRPNHKLHLIDNGHRSQRAARKTRDEQLVIDMVVPNLGSPGLTKKAPKKAAKKTSRLRKQRQNKKRPYVKQQISTAASEPGLMICEPSDWSETTHLHSPSVWPITPTTGSSGDLLSDQLIMGDEVVVQSQSDLGQDPSVFADAASSAIETDEANIWTSDDDNAIRAHVQYHGCANFYMLVESLPSRNAQQCRKRWVEELSGLKVPRSSSRQLEEPGSAAKKARTAKTASPVTEWSAGCSMDASGVGSLRRQARTNRNIGKSGETEHLSSIVSVSDFLKGVVQHNGVAAAVDSNVPIAVECTSTDVKTDAAPHYWTVKEDKILESHVHSHGSCDWSTAVALLGCRTESHCSERWAELERSWARIAKMQSSRCDSMVEDHSKPALRNQPNKNVIEIETVAAHQPLVQELPTAGGNGAPAKQCKLPHVKRTTPIKRHRPLPEITQLEIVECIGNDHTVWSGSDAYITYVMAACQSAMTAPSLLQWVREDREGSPEEAHSLIERHIRTAVKRFITNRKADKLAKLRKTQSPLVTHLEMMIVSSISISAKSLQNCFVAIEQCHMIEDAGSQLQSTQRNKKLKREPPLLAGACPARPPRDQLGVGDGDHRPVQEEAAQGAAGSGNAQSQAVRSSKIPATDNANLSTKKQPSRPCCGCVPSCGLPANACASAFSVDRC